MGCHGNLIEAFTNFELFFIINFAIAYFVGLNHEKYRELYDIKKAAKSI